MKNTIIRFAVVTLILAFFLFIGCASGAKSTESGVLTLDGGLLIFPTEKGITLHGDKKSATSVPYGSFKFI